MLKNWFSNTHKIYELENKNEDLQKKVKNLEAKNEELQNTIKNKGYKVPETKNIYFINSNKWIAKVHYSHIINEMNARGIEIVSTEFGNFFAGFFFCDAWFTIQYKLPPEMKSANFSYSNTENTYTKKFYFEYFK